ncbi:hypothetical protein KC319_g22 [Hortaea werneckii]|nr:hypothetical protein KC319_g22 [Hortaea werneckii]
MSGARGRPTSYSDCPPATMLQQLLQQTTTCKRQPCLQCFERQKFETLQRTPSRVYSSAKTRVFATRSIHEKLEAPPRSGLSFRNRRYSPGESFHCADQKEKSFFALVRLRLRNYAPTAWGLTISLNATKCLVGLQVAFRASAGISITWKAQFGERLRTNLASVA